MSFIYALCDPVTHEVRYIGKANDPEGRFATHLLRAARPKQLTHCSNWIRKLLRDGKQPVLRILAEVQADERWQDVERRFIAEAITAGKRLTNIRAGGEGASFLDPNSPSAKRWLKAMKKAWQKPEVRKRWREAMVEVNARPEVKAKRSRKSKANWRKPEFRRKIHTPEARAKMSTKLKSYWKQHPDLMAKRMNDPKRVAKISAAIAKRNKTDITLHDKVRADWADPEHRANRLANMAATKADPAWRKQFAASIKKSWSDPAVRKKRGALQRNPEVNAKRSATLKATWARRKAEMAQQR